MFTKNQILNWLFIEGLAEVERNWGEVNWLVESENENELGFKAILADLEDDGKEYIIDPVVIRRGIRVGFEKRHELGDPYQRAAFTDLQFGAWDDVDYDAFTADYLIQLALFGEVRYS